MNKVTTVADGVVRFFEEKKEPLPSYEITDGARYQIIHWKGKSAPLFSFCDQRGDQ